MAITSIDYFSKGKFKTIKGYFKTNKIRYSYKRKLLYSIWNNMKERCYNPNFIGYKYYGGCGISICEAWKNSYMVFSNWAKSHGYKEGLTIHRKKNHLGYFPENCEWLTKSKHSKWHNSFRGLKKRSKRFLDSLVANNK